MTDCEYVWQALGRFPVRRAMLGRKQCDAIVATAVEQAPSQSEVLFAGPVSEALRDRWEQRVRLIYTENCGFAFTTVLLWWAISAIVEALIRKWLENHK